MSEDLKKYIVLDLDATLINTFNTKSGKCILKMSKNNNDLAYLRSKMYSINTIDWDEQGKEYEISFLGVIRPYLEEFIEYLIERFDEIFIWSAGSKGYVNSVTEFIFNPHKYKPKIIFVNKETVFDGYTVIKPLEKLLEQFREKYSYIEDQPTLKNTYFIDDRADVGSMNKKNMIIVPPYHIENMEFKDDGTELETFISEIDRKDTALKDLIRFFDKTHKEKDITDIRDLDKRYIFKHDDDYNKTRNQILSEAASPSLVK